MKTLEAPSVTQTQPEQVQNGTKAPAPGAVKAAVAEVKANDEQTIARLMAENLKLKSQLTEAQAASGEELKKAPVSDADLNTAMAQLEQAGEADAKSASPRPTPNLGLAALLGVRPDFTKSQAQRWKALKVKLAKLYSVKHRELFAARKKLFDRAKRNPASLVATLAKVREDGTAQRVSLTVKEPAKARRKKADAKPGQVAGKVPTAGNAKNPASV